MNIEDQVCSLELAQKLLTLGVNENASYYYLNIDGEGKYYVYDYYHLPEECEYEGDEISAYLPSELLNMLPNYVQVKDKEPFDNFRIFITRFNSVDEDRNVTNNFIVNYECDSTEIEGQEAWLRRKLASNIYDPNLANALAKMLIYLLENGLIKND
jgi:hypothetical protein